MDQESDVFRQYKTLGDSFRNLKGIKKLPIQEIKLEAVMVDTERQVKVSYKLIDTQNFVEMSPVLKRWPKPSMLDDERLPDLTPWKSLSKKRHQAVVDHLDKISEHVTDEHNASVPHCSTDEAPSMVDRGGNAVVADHPAPVVAAPTTPPTPPDSPPLSPPPQLEIDIHSSRR